MSRACLITGAGQRLGQEMAVALAQSGWRIAIHHRSSTTGAEETLSRVRAAGSDGALVQADLGIEDQVRALIPKAGDALDAPITGLVNNASLFEDGQRIGPHPAELGHAS